MKKSVVAAAVFVATSVLCITPAAAAGKTTVATATSYATGDQAQVTMKYFPYNNGESSVVS